jgi:hypothetical protein
MERSDRPVSSRGDAGNDDQERWIRGDRLQQRQPPERRGGRRQGLLSLGSVMFGEKKIREK